MWPLQEDGISRPLSMTRFVSLPAELSVISEQPAVEAEASWMQPVDEGGDGGEGMESLEAEVEAELSGGGEQVMLLRFGNVAA